MDCLRYRLEVMELAGQVFWARDSLGEAIGCTPEDRRFWGRYCRLLARIGKCIKTMRPRTLPFRLAAYRAKQLDHLRQGFWRARHSRDEALKRVLELRETFELAEKYGSSFALTPKRLSDLQGLADAAARDRDVFSVARLLPPLPALSNSLYEALKDLRVFILMWIREITGRTDAVSQSLLERDYLRKPDLMGQTALHVAAESGALDALPGELLAGRNVLACDGFGWMPLHYAASSGHLNQVPERLLNAQALLIKTSGGWNSVHLAFAHGHASQLPSSVLTPAVVTSAVGAGANCLHLAALNGSFLEVPAEFQTMENVLHGDDRQQNCLHYAAVAGHLREFPSRFKTLETLYIRDAMGRSSVDYAIQHARAHNR